MNLSSIDGCGCERCPVDLEETAFLTEWEDQSFSGKGCLWHRQIRGTKGIISPDINGGEPAIFVQLKDRSFTAPLSELRLWAKRIGAKRK